MCPLPRQASFLCLVLLAGCHLIYPFDLKRNDSGSDLSEHQLDGGGVTDSAPGADSDSDSTTPSDSAALSDHGPLVGDIWVDDDWAGTAIGKAVMPGYTFGTNAFDTIIKGLAAAVDGDTIMVAPGTYPETVLVTTKNITLQGPGKPGSGAAVLLDSSEMLDIVEVTAEGVTISGFEITGGQKGIYVTASKTTIQNNIVHDLHDHNGSNGVGILLYGNIDDSVVTGNEVYDCDRQGIYLGGDYYQASERNLIQKNKVYKNGRTVEEAGIQLQYADDNIIRENEIYQHQLTSSEGSAGIELIYSHRNKIEKNKVYENTAGIFLNNSEDHTITGNDLYKNGWGIYYDKDSVAGTIRSANSNRFCGNVKFAVNNEAPTYPVSAKGCWWGKSTGPGGAGPGTGDPVSQGVDYSGYLTTKPAGPCSSIP